MEKIQIPQDANTIVSTSRKGDQSKWLIGDKWIKENTRGYENMAEYVAYLILDCSTLPRTSFVSYTPCLFEAHFETTDDILNHTPYSTIDKFKAIMDKVHLFTELDVSLEVAQMLAFDALILNEDRHTNNILFLFNPVKEVWQLAPIFDHGLSLLSDLKDYPLDKPLSILKRKIKAKLASSFSKQLALYDGEPFLKRSLLLEKLDQLPYDIGRAREVVFSKIQDMKFQKLFID